MLWYCWRELMLNLNRCTNCCSWICFISFFFVLRRLLCFVPNTDWDLWWVSFFYWGWSAQVLICVWFETALLIWTFFAYKISFWFLEFYLYSFVKTLLAVFFGQRWWLLSFSGVQMSVWSFVLMIGPNVVHRRQDAWVCVNCLILVESWFLAEIICLILIADDWINRLQIQGELLLVSLCLPWSTVEFVDVIVMFVIWSWIVILSHLLCWRRSSSWYCFHTLAYLCRLLFIGLYLIHSYASFIFHVSAATKLLKKEDCLAQIFALGDMQTCLVISILVVYVSATFVDQKQGYLLQITQRC